MTKRKTLPIKDTVGAKDNRQAVANFDQLGLTDLELIAELRRRNWWGYLEKGQLGEDRGIEVKP